jgi:hypothetical protein
VDAGAIRRHHRLVHDGVLRVEVRQLAPSTLTDPGDEPLEHLAGRLGHARLLD